MSTGASTTTRAGGEGGGEDGNKKKGTRYHERQQERVYATLSTKQRQRHHLEKLMADPEKPVDIPERPEDWKPPEAPEFKRFYMGSSAGAGSEVFHVYRHLRRFETIRQDWIRDTAEKEDKDLEFQRQLAEKKNAAEAKTAKKRAKRLKKKQAKQNKLAEKKGESIAMATTQVKEDKEASEEDDNDGQEEDDAFENPFIIKGK